ncbi:MAG: Peptidoglycan-binding lysin domain protein [Anaerocolumna sp.]|jgi:spore germination protein|nr:Peptidoglycan-binding lysin domain protein [Anaerocolumna sp.]
MIIHVVQPEDTINSIANTYGVLAPILIRENGLENQTDLVIGQTIVIAYPEIEHVVKEGDTFLSIAQMYDVTFLELLRNNPFLSEVDYVYPGERLVIKYNNEGIKISTNGYTYPFINIDILKKTLPFLTYLSIFSYRVTLEGNLINIEDEEVIEMAKAYGVAPIMILSTISNAGIDSIDINTNIFNNPSIQQNIIEQTLKILKEKGYYGVNLYIQYINLDNQDAVEQYIDNISNQLNAEGYLVFVTLTPNTFINVQQPAYINIDYSKIGEFADKILLLSYEWGYSFGPPAAVTDFELVKDMLEYAITQIPAEKIMLGLPIIGYDWELPFVKGTSKANALTTEAAINLALEVGAVILYDERARAPYFTYKESDLNGDDIEHIVWFKDARSIDSLVKLTLDLKFDGVAVWNIMQYFDQLWLVINSQYKINNLMETST